MAASSSAMELPETVSGSRMSKRPSAWKEGLSKKGRKDAVSLNWVNLSYSIKVDPKPEPGGKRRMPWNRAPKVDKMLLKNVTGYAKAGSFVAIMGPSGAGKTTLMNLLAGRVQVKGHLEGELLLNGQPLERKALKGISGYVLQDDLLLPHLTVREALQYAALLKLPTSMSKEEKFQRVEDVINELNLTNCANTKIGNTLVRGVSGGERKRTAIGVELMKDPSVLFLDEPTTGLDSFTSLNIITTLKALAASGRTIITTIHQPSSNIFEQFDMLLLLARGEVSFFGPANQSLAYFAGLGFPPPDHSNPADYFLDLTADDLRSEENQATSGKRVEQLIESFKASKWATLAEDKSGTGEISKHGPGFSGWWNQFTVLAARAARNSYRDRVTYGVRLVQSIMIGLIMGLIFLNLGLSQNSVFNRLGLLFFIMLNQGFGAMFSALNTFPAEAKVVNRERLVGMYQVSAYYLSKQVVELPLQLVFPLITGTMLYWMAGLQANAGKFFIFLLTLILTTANAESMGIMISVIFPNTAIAMAVAPMILIVFLLFSGFYINMSSIGPWFIWIAYISYIRWGFEALVINEFTGLVFTCNPGEVCSWQTGEQVIAYLQWENGEIWYCLLIILCEVLFFRTVSYIVMRLRKPM